MTMVTAITLRMTTSLQGKGGELTARVVLGSWG
jgi:hypothetical protein